MRRWHQYSHAAKIYYLPIVPMFTCVVEGLLSNCGLVKKSMAQDIGI